jgi:hypothetical protein
MEYSSRRGENVLDLFGGSGSTLIAAEQAGRKAFLMEPPRRRASKGPERSHLTAMWQLMTRMMAAARRTSSEAFRFSMGAPSDFVGSPDCCTATPAVSVPCISLPPV